MPARGLPHRFGQLIETLRGDGRQQRVLIREMAVRRVVRYTRPPRHLPQREALAFPDHLHARPQQRFAQIAVMIRPPLGHLHLS